MVIGLISGRLDLFPRSGATLAQAPWATPPHLPAPPEVSHYLLERPVLAGAVLLLFAAVALFGGRAQGRPKPAAIIGAVFALLAVAIFLAGTFIRTDRERLLERTRDLVDAVRVGDTAAAGDILAENLVVNAGGGSIGLDRDAILAAIDLFPEQLAIEGHRVEQRRASIDGDGLGRSQLQVRGGPAGGGPNITWWEFSWRRAGDERWRIHTIDLLLVNGKPPEQALGDLIRRRVN